jgi:hypothetical protein
MLVTSCLVIALGYLEDAFVVPPVVASPATKIKVSSTTARVYLSACIHW